MANILSKSEIREYFNKVNELPGFIDRLDRYECSEVLKYAYSRIESSTKAVYDMFRIVPSYIDQVAPRFLAAGYEEDQIFNYLLNEDTDYLQAVEVIRIIKKSNEPDKSLTKENSDTEKVSNPAVTVDPDQSNVKKKELTDLDVTIKIVCMAYHYLHAFGIYPIEEYTLNGKQNAEFYKKLTKRHGGSASSYGCDWNPINENENNIRIKKPEDIKKAILFLKSEFNEYDTQAAINLANTELDKSKKLP